MLGRFGANQRAGAKHRLGRTALGLVAIATFLVAGLLGTGQAWAVVDNGYAPYIWPWSHDWPTWHEFTWLGISGSGYDYRADYIVGVQRQLNYLDDYNPGPNDGIFGSQTRSAAIEYQRDCGIDDDGIVGEVTWLNLALDIEYDYSSAGYDYHYPEECDGADYWRHNQSTDRWGIRNSNNSAWVAFTAGGPS